MLSSVSKCSRILTILLACTFFTGSGARAINNADRSGVFSAFAEIGSFPRTHEEYKDIRIRYNNNNSPNDNNANYGVKFLDRRHGMKSEGYDYNKDDDICSKCKWENDDYWERDEPEEEANKNNEDECDDGDDGQYRPDKTYHNNESGSKSHASGLHPLGVHKIGPIDIYGGNVKGGVKEGKPDGLLDATNFPTNTRYVESTNVYGSTPKPVFSWNTPFAGTSKSGYSGITTDTYVTTPSYGSGTGWNRGTTSAGFGSLVWDGKHGNRFAESFGTTSRPTWSAGFGGSPTTAGFLFSQKLGLNRTASNNNTSAGSYGTTPKLRISWSTGTSTSTNGFPTSHKPGTLWSSGYDDKLVGSYGTTLIPEQRWNIGFSPKGSSFLNKHESNWNHDNIPTRSFGTTPKPESNWNIEFETNIGATKTPLGHISTPGSSDSLYGEIRPKSTSLNAASSGAFAGANANMFGTTFEAFNSPGITASISSAPSVRTNSPYPGVKGLSESRSTYEIGHHGTQPDIAIDSWPGQQHEVGTLGTQPNGGNAPWLDKQSESDIMSGGYPKNGAENWPNRQSGDGRATIPGGYSGSNSGTWLGAKSDSRITPGGYHGIRTSPGRHSAGGSNTWPQQPGDRSGTWSSGQVGHGSRLDCASGSCGSPTGSFSESRGCEKNYNCDGCREGSNNAPAIYGPCGGVISGSSGVSKTYYPAGIGDSNVSNIAKTYRPGSFPNIGNGAYSGVNTECGRGDNSCNQGRRLISC